MIVMKSCALWYTLFASATSDLPTAIVILLPAAATMPTSAIDR